ncbi:MAG: hypothetical protein OXB92_12595, partial [Acidimicrobiaceae bacterium]|nr:hypothetical protein [Acidimicrobiaceae bacterium]
LPPRERRRHRRAPLRNTTALHFAVQFQRRDMVQLLLDRGAATTIQDDAHHSDAAGWARACDDNSEPATAVRELLGVLQGTIRAR